MSIAIYPGSFDPMTRGHLAILTATSKLFSRLVVAVLVNPEKKPLFSPAERVSMIEACTSHLSNVEVDSFQGLLADYALDRGAHVIVRGLREVSDFENEMKMAHMNQQLNPSVQTIFIPTDPQHSFVSSSLVKQVAFYGGDVSNFVPSPVAEAMRAKSAGRA